MQEYIQKHIQKSIDIKNKILQNTELKQLIEKAAKAMIKTYKNGGKILLAGNGGSAADAQHLAGELVSRFYFDRPGLGALALSTDTSILTAIGNDYGYEKIFSRQLEANACEHDLFIAISTSGKSPNIIEALRFAKAKNITSIGLSGEGGGQMSALCDFCLAVPSTETPRIQEAHILIGHILCAIVEKELFGETFDKSFFKN